MLRVGWLLSMAFSGWTTGEIVGAQRPGRIANVLLGVIGGSGVFFLLEILGIHVQDLNLILFGVWGAAALPGFIGILMRHRDHTNVRISVRTLSVPPSPEPDNHSDLRNTQKAA